MRKNATFFAVPAVSFVDAAVRPARRAAFVRRIVSVLFRLVDFARRVMDFVHRLAEDKLRVVEFVRRLMAFVFCDAEYKARAGVLPRLAGIRGKLFAALMQEISAAKENTANERAAPRGGRGRGRRQALVVFRVACLAG